MYDKLQYLVSFSLVLFFFFALHLRVAFRIVKFFFYFIFFLIGEVDGTRNTGICGYGKCNVLLKIPS
jgi:hypothetical protein